MAISPSRQARRGEWVTIVVCPMWVRHNKRSTAGGAILTSTSGSVSTFLSAPDTFVVEFDSVASVNVSPAYTVSYQIVLHSNGDIGLNYRNVPSQINPPPAVTIGVESFDERFMFQVACSTPDQIIGELPKSNQSYLIKARYLH